MVDRKQDGDAAGGTGGLLFEDDGLWQMSKKEGVALAD
jgi:hypothetical protein